MCTIRHMQSCVHNKLHTILCAQHATCKKLSGYLVRTTLKVVIVKITVYTRSQNNDKVVKVGVIVAIVVVVVVVVVVSHTLLHVIIVKVLLNQGDKNFKTVFPLICMHSS